MDSNLDQMDLTNQDNSEFEQFLDDWYAIADAEYAEREIGKLEMAQREYEKLGDF